MVFIGTFKHRWIFWTSPHWELLINMLSKLSRNLRSGVSGISGLQIHHNISVEKETLNKKKRTEK
jgi:hypothetical protein